MSAGGWCASMWSDLTLGWASSQSLPQTHGHSHVPPCIPLSCRCQCVLCLLLAGHRGDSVVLDEEDGKVNGDMAHWKGNVAKLKGNCFEGRLIWRLTIWSLWWNNCFSLFCNVCLWVGGLKECPLKCPIYKLSISTWEESCQVGKREINLRSVHEHFKEIKVPGNKQNVLWRWNRVGS